MGFAGYCVTVIKESRWWRRRKQVTLTLWPDFLAQRLCPHIHKNPFMWGEKTVTFQCVDCHKRITEINTCPHAEVSVASYDVDGKHYVSRSFRCNSCGVSLSPNELPKDAKIAPMTVTAAPSLM